MKIKSGHIPRIIMTIVTAMIFNSLVVLADVNTGEDKLKFKAVFDIFDENKSINGGSQITEVEVTGDDPSTGGVLQSDTINASINTTNIFIMEAGFTDEEKEIIKKKNCDKDYYIDMAMVQEVYKEGLVRYIGHRDNLIKFIIDGKILLERYEDGESSILENIYFTLDNKIVVKNDAQCIIKEPEEPQVDNINEKREYYYIKRENLLDAEVLYIKSSDKDSPKLDGNIYMSKLRGARVPSYTFNSYDVEKYLDLKNNPIFRDELKYYFEDGERKQNSFQFNLVGYEIQSQGKKYTTFISEKEYALIELIGMDKFVYLKSKDDSFLMDYPENKTYLFDYSYNQDRDQIGLNYRGELDKLGQVDLDFSSYIDGYIARMGENLLIRNKGLDIDNIDIKKKIINQLISEQVGSNIISEIIRGEYIYARDKDNNDLTKIELNAKYEKIRGEMNEQRDLDNEYLDEIKDLKYEAILSGRMGLRSFSLRADEAGFLVEKNNLNQMNYRHKKIRDYYESEMLDDLTVDRVEARDPAVEATKKIKYIMDQIIENEKKKYEILEAGGNLKDLIVDKAQAIVDKDINQAYYLYMEKAEELLEIDKEGPVNPNLIHLEIRDLTDQKDGLDSIKAYEHVAAAKEKLDGEIDKLSQSRKILEDMKKSTDEEILDILDRISKEEIEGIEGLEEIKTIDDFDKEIIKNLNIIADGLDKDYDSLKSLDQKDLLIKGEKTDNDKEIQDAKDDLEEKKDDGKEDIKNEISKLIKEKQDYIKELNALNRKKYNQELELRKLEAELVSLEYNLILSKAEVKRIEDIIAALDDEDEIAYYEKELAYANKFLTSDQERVDSKKAEIEKLEVDLEETKQAFEDKDKGKAEKFKEIDEKIAEQEALLNGKINELKEIIDKISVDPNIKIELNKDIGKKYLEILDFKSQIEEKKRQLNILANEEINISSELAEKDEEIDKLNTFIDGELKQKKRQSEIAKTKLENHETMEELKEQIQVLEADLLAEDELGKIKESIKVLDEELLDLRENLLELEKEEERNEEEIGALKEEIDKKEKDRQAKQDILDRDSLKRKEIEVKNKKIEAINLENQKLDQEMESIEKQVYRVEDYREKEEELLLLEASLKEKNSTISLKQEEIKKKEEELKKLNSQLPKDEEKIKKLEEEIEDLRAEIEKLEKEIGGTEENIGLIEEIKNLKLEIYIESSLILESEEAIARLEAEKLDVMDELDSNEDEIEKINLEIKGLEVKVNTKLKDIDSDVKDNSKFIDDNKLALDRQKDYIDKEKELTENLKETIRALGDRKSLEVDQLKNFAMKLGQLEYYIEGLEAGKGSHEENEGQMELLLGELEYIQDYIKTYKFQRDRYDYQYIHERIEEDKMSLFKPLDESSGAFKGQKDAITKARYENFNLKNNENLESLRKLQTDDYTMTDEDMKSKIDSFKAALNKFKDNPEDEKDYDALKTAIKDIKTTQGNINKNNEKLKNYNGAKSGETIYKYEILKLKEIDAIETEISKGDNMDIAEIETLTDKLEKSFDAYLKDFNEQLENLDRIKADIENFKVEKNGSEIPFDSAIEEIDGVLEKLKSHKNSTKEIAKLFENNVGNPLTSGNNQHGGSFRLLYKISENNEGAKDDDLQDYTVNIPWIKSEKIENIQGMEELGHDYINLGFEHMSGLFNKGKHTLTSSQRESVYYIFNPSLNPDGSFSLLNYDGNRPMEVKLPKDRKFIISDENIRKFIEDKRAYENSSKFSLKLAYIKVDDEIIWRDELEDQSLVKEGQVFELKNGRLSIYHHTLQKENEKLLELYKNEKEEDKRLKLLDQINKNIGLMKSDYKAPRVQLIFEDDLNLQYFISYVDDLGKKILDPVKIKSLVGMKFELDGPKYIVNQAGEKFELIGPKKHIVDSNLNENDKNPIKTYEFKYRKIGQAFQDEKFDIPGYDLVQLKKPGNKINYQLNKTQETSKIEKDDKNNQANFKLDGQKDLNIRFINVEICSIKNCQVHTGEQRGTRLGSEVIGWLHSKMYLPADKSVLVDLRPYLDKYGSGIWSYGLEASERGVKYPINLPKDGLLNIDKDFAKESGEIYINLYNVSYLPHYPGGGGTETPKRYFEYTLDHKYFNREADHTENSGYTDYDKARGDYSINLKYDMGILSSVMTTDFTNFIYKYWDQYEPYVMGTDVKNRSFDKLLIKNMDYKTLDIKDENGNIIDREIEESLIHEQALIHNPTLDKGAYKYSEIKDKDGRLVRSIYEINFLTTSHKSLMDSDWYEYKGFRDTDNERRTIQLYKELNARNEKARKTLFEYYFTGDPIWTPEVVKTKVIEEHVDIMTGHVFSSMEYTVYVGDSIQVMKPLEAIWPENYEYIYTKPDVERFLAEKGENRISHYYMDKDYIEIKYFANGGRFGDGNENDITSLDRTERRVIGKLDELLSDYHPKDLARTGYDFVSWTEKKEIDGKEVYLPVGEDRMVEKGLELYAKWEKTKDPIIIFHSNGGEFDDGSSIKNIVGKEGARVLSYEPGVRRPGYSFIEWTFDQAGNDPVGDRILKKEERLDVYGQWRKDSDGGGGGDKPDPKPPVVIPPVEPDKDRKGREIGSIIEPKIEYELNKIDHFAYIKGYPDVSVQPKGNITREEVAMVFYRLMEPEYRSEIETSENSFTDVDDGRWSTKAISTLANGQLLLGYGDGTFKPQSNMTRAEISKVIARFTDTIVLETQIPDIIDHWAEDYINTVENKGWVKGYEDGSFKPNELLSRAEFVTMMNALLDRKVKRENILNGIKVFKDLEKNKWYYEPMVEAINGHDYELERLYDGSEKWIKLVDTQYPD